MMMGWGDGGAWQAPRTGRMFGWEKILQTDGRRVWTNPFIHDVLQSSSIRIWCYFKMPCVKGFSMLQKQIRRDKKLVLKTTCCPLTLTLLTLERECKVPSCSWRGVAWKFAGLIFRNVDNPFLNWLLSFLSYYGFVYQGGFQNFQQVESTAANHCVIGKTEAKVFRAFANKSDPQNGHVRITWVSGVPHWSLCSSWWSSPSPAAPSLWSRRLAIDLAITVYRTASQLNSRADLEKEKKKTHSIMAWQHVLTSPDWFSLILASRESCL